MTGNASTEHELKFRNLNTNKSQKVPETNEAGQSQEALTRSHQSKLLK